MAHPPPPQSIGLWQRVVLMDRAILRRVRTWERDWVTPLMRLATRAGDASSWILLTLLIFAMGENMRHYFWLLTYATLCSTCIAHALKRIFRRKRPCLEHIGVEALVVYPDQYSFPSGHTTTAFAVAAILLHEGSYLGAGSTIAALWIASSRIYLGAHYPLDVFLGAAIGSTVGLTLRVLFF